MLKINTNINTRIASLKMNNYSLFLRLINNSKTIEDVKDVLREIANYLSENK